MKSTVRIALIALSLVLAGCSREPIARLMAADDAVDAATQVIDGSVQGHYDLVQARLAVESRYILSPWWQTMIRRQFAGLQPDPQVAAWSTQSFLGNSEPVVQEAYSQSYGMKAHLTLRYVRSNGDAVFAKFDLVKRRGTYYVAGLGWWQRNASEIAENTYSTSTKPAKQTLVLFTALAVLVFLLVSTASCLLSRDLAYKPAWLAAIWVGAIQLSLNWSTGELTLLPFDIALPPVWFDQQNMWEPLIVQMLVPVGAIYYWVARAKRMPLPVCKIPAKEG